MLWTLESWACNDDLLLNAGARFCNAQMVYARVDSARLYSFIHSFIVWGNQVVLCGTLDIIMYLETAYSFQEAVSMLPNNVNKKCLLPDGLPCTLIERSHSAFWGKILTSHPRLNSSPRCCKTWTNGVFCISPLLFLSVWQNRQIFVIPHLEVVKTRGRSNPQIVIKPLLTNLPLTCCAWQILPPSLAHIQRRV